MSDSAGEANASASALDDSKVGALFVLSTQLIAQKLARKLLAVTGQKSGFDFFPGWFCSQAPVGAEQRDSAVLEKENLESVDTKGTAGRAAAENGKTDPSGDAASGSSSGSDDEEEPDDKNNSHCSICRVSWRGIAERKARPGCVVSDVVCGVGFCVGQRGGELLCCDTCPKAYHVKWCVRCSRRCVNCLCLSPRCVLVALWVSA